MKYIINEENSCGQATLTDDLRNMVLESLGRTPGARAASLIPVDDPPDVSVGAPSGNNRGVDIGGDDA